MRQMTFAMAGFERYSKTTRRAAFLAEMERVVPWPQRSRERLHPNPDFLLFAPAVQV
jgi:hypothetical protein